MTCVHLRKLYALCQEHDLKLAGSDLIHIICPECGEKEVCPSEMMEDIADDEDAIPPLRKQNQMPDAGGPQPTRESALTEPRSRCSLGHMCTRRRSYNRRIQCGCRFLHTRFARNPVNGYRT